MRAFDDEEDANVSGQFNFSKYLLVSENEYAKTEIDAQYARIYQRME